MSFHIYTSEINLDTLKQERHDVLIEEDEEPNIDSYEYAAYNEDGFGNIYAESLISQETADKLVRDFAADMAEKFKKAYEL